MKKQQKYTSLQSGLKGNEKSRKMSKNEQNIEKHRKNHKMSYRYFAKMPKTEKISIIERSKLKKPRKT